jgi:hypothetical protein
MLLDILLISTKVPVLEFFMQRSSVLNYYDCVEEICEVVICEHKTAAKVLELAVFI